MSRISDTCKEALQIIAENNQRFAQWEEDQDLEAQMLEGIQDNKATVENVTIEKMESIPAGANPYNFDSFNMGQTFGTNVTLMFSNHSTQECRYIIIVHEDGRRWKIRIPV